MINFKPLYTTSRADSVAQFVAERYELALPLDCRMLNRGFNDVYLVVAATGERHIFRLSHHRARGTADVETETDFLRHLDRTGVPVAIPVPTRDGPLFVRGQAPEGCAKVCCFATSAGARLTPRQSRMPVQTG